MSQFRQLVYAMQFTEPGSLIPVSKKIIAMPYSMARIKWEAAGEIMERDMKKQKKPTKPGKSGKKC